MTGDRVFSLDGMTCEQFESLVNLLADRISHREVRVQFCPPPSAIFLFNEEQMERRLKKSGLPAASMGQLRWVIPLMVQGILTGNRTTVCQFLAQQARPKVEKGAEKPTNERVREEIDSRIRAVEQKVVTERLRRDYYIKSRAKTNTYVETLWDLTEKQQDSAGNPPPGLSQNATTNLAEAHQLAS